VSNPNFNRDAEAAKRSLERVQNLLNNAQHIQDTGMSEAQANLQRMFPGPEISDAEFDRYFDSYNNYIRQDPSVMGDIHYEATPRRNTRGSLHGLPQPIYNTTSGAPASSFDDTPVGRYEYDEWYVDPTSEPTSFNKYTNTSRPTRTLRRARQTGAHQVTDAQNVVQAALEGRSARTRIRPQAPSGNLRTESFGAGSGLSVGQLPHAFRQHLNNQEDAIDHIVYSYDTPIAWREAHHDLETNDITHRWVMPKTKYSRTTSRHQALLASRIQEQFPISQGDYVSPDDRENEITHFYPDLESAVGE